uniref:Uncharacterized protein n=1 Tax=Eptatretus burgeri TaxID=7764 RepID=A0A8C4Q4M8_EPTBU
MGFYEEWWFLVVVALCSFGFVVLLVFGLLARGQNRKYARKSDSGNTPRMGAEELTSLDGGFPALEMESRRLPIKSGLSIKPGLSFKPPLSIKPGLQRRNGTQPRSPPRPSPGTLHYSDEELMPYEVTREAEPPPDLTESQQVKDEDFPPDIAKEQPHSFVNHYISDPSYYHSWNRKPKVFSHSEDQAQLVVAAGVGQALQRGLYVCTANGRPPDAPGPPTGLSSFV